MDEIIRKLEEADEALLDMIRAMISDDMDVREIIEMESLKFSHYKIRKGLDNLRVIKSNRDAREVRA